MVLQVGTKYLKKQEPEVFFPKKDKNGKTYYEGVVRIFVEEKKSYDEENMGGDSDGSV
jgi:hypothetical protein